MSGSCRRLTCGQRGLGVDWHRAESANGRRLLSEKLQSPLSNVHEEEPETQKDSTMYHLFWIIPLMALASFLYHRLKPQTSNEDWIIRREWK